VSFISAHILDALAGTPARGVSVRLESDGGETLGTAVTDADGRVTELGPDSLDPGAYRVTFGTGEYFAGRRQETFYPSVTVSFTVVAGERHYHVPLLLSPYSYTTYRGS
jgi:5-hydroxyisourate hydrolase